MDKRDLKREYKQTRQTMGVYQIRNLINEKVFVGSSLNIDGIFNRHKFALNAGSYSDKALQADWNKLGAEKFAFEILEELEPRENLDNKKELEFLEDLWLENLQPYDTKGYNKRKMTREERLRMISANRKL